MRQRVYFIISATIFALVCLLHLGRAAAGIQVRVDGVEFPIWLSWGGLVVSGVLSIWGFRLAAR